jgi:hypothetical protein
MSSLAAAHGASRNHQRTIVKAYEEAAATGAAALWRFVMAQRYAAPARRPGRPSLGRWH